MVKFNVKEKLLSIFDNIKPIKYVMRKLGIRDSDQVRSKLRTIYINNEQPMDYTESEVNKPFMYKSNRIKTSKYNILNFLPKNLFEQFRRIANFYFLINVIIIFIIPDPPTSPYTSIVPLLFVVLVTAVKQAYEDVLRHKSDNEVNNLPIRILRNGKFTQLKWQDIHCGDIVEVKAETQLPCDLLLLFSDTTDGISYKTTANLDGETNLKRRSVPARFPTLRTEEEFDSLRGVITCDKPNLRLYEFNGKIIYNNEQYPIVNENILLRGSTLKIAPVIYGCALYTGLETKMMMNSKFKSNKLSCIERKLNKYIGVFLALLMLLTFSCFAASFAFNSLYPNKGLPINNHWYLDGRKPAYFDSNPSLYNFIILVTIMNLFNYIIPLSMYVTIEMQRFVGSQFIEWDIELYDEKTNQPAKANTSDLNEDLGQIEYLFSDKTGTLTENEMDFKEFSIEGVIYEQKNGIIYQEGSQKSISLIENEQMVKFFEILALCHTVQIDENAKERYQASSPDEFSFIQYCLKLDIIYEGEDKDPNSSAMIRKIIFKNSTLRFKVLQVFEFDATRKRMSVVLEDMQTKKIVLFCKGAETSIFPICTQGSIQKCRDDIDTFAIKGWRTLALSYKYLTISEYSALESKLDDAANDILNREKKLIKAFEEAESNLILVGATAVEDKLQEDVADTLETLRRAGIKIWVLTGDKRETAINISHSCKHFADEMVKLSITDLKTSDEIKARIEMFEKQISQAQNDSYALIIDGFTLGYLFNSDLADEFRNVCMKCEAVLCCRMSPSQKADVVRLVKKSKSKPMTCAIGDGANDVSMIQEAHVGLGLYGKEGRNAARSADFAFAKFKFTKRILLVQGFLFYTRASNLVQYFFYKNFAFAIGQFYFSCFNGFSVASLYDSIVLTFYNVIFTAAPILLFGLFEQKIGIEKLAKNPYLYRTIKKNRTLRTFEFAKWNSLALWHSVISFFFAYALFSRNNSFTDDGKMRNDKYSMGALVLTSTVILVHVKLFIEWQYKSLFMVVGYLMSIFGYVLLAIVINAITVPSLFQSFTDYMSLYWIYFSLYSNGPVWFLLFLEIIVAIIPDLIIKILENLRDVELIRKEKENEQDRIERSKRNLENKLRKNGDTIELNSIEGFHRSSLTDDRIFQPVTYDSSADSGKIGKNKIFIAPPTNSIPNSVSYGDQHFVRINKSPSHFQETNEMFDLKKRNTKHIGQADRIFSVEEIK